MNAETTLVSVRFFSESTQAIGLNDTLQQGVPQVNAVLLYMSQGADSFCPPDSSASLIPNELLFYLLPHSPTEERGMGLPSASP